MERSNVLIVGGSAAGVTAAVTARRFHPDAKITLLRKEEKVLIPCGIPYIYGTVGTPEKNLIPDAVLEKSGVEWVVDEVLSIDREATSVTTAGGGTYGYDRLILTTGSIPLIPPLPGADLENVFPIWKDVGFLQGMLDTLRDAHDVVVIGGGFIGVEFADECAKMGGLTVKVIEMLPHCLFLACDEPVCARAEAALQENGIELLMDRRAKAIVGNGKVTAVELLDGEKLEADVVILGIGVAPNVSLAQEAGLDVDVRAGIAVDDFMRTSDPSIFAAGDCAGRRCYFTGRPSPLRLASVACTEARIAAANLDTLRRRNPGAIGVFSTRVGNLALGSAGMTEKAAREAGLEVVTGEATAPDKHPGCMPETSDLAVKLVFQRENRVIVGGQVHGGASTGELVNFIGALIQQRATADEIATFQVGTHPALTASPIAYQIVNAAENALGEMTRS